MAKKVLVVDDDPKVAEVVSRAARDVGYEVEVAVGGEAALKSLAKSSFGLLLVDIRMPPPDGEAVIRSLPPDEPKVVAMIGSSFELPTWLKDRVDGILVKPFTGGDLMSLLQLEWGVVQ